MHSSSAPAPPFASPAHNHTLLALPKRPAEVSRAAPPPDPKLAAVVLALQPALALRGLARAVGVARVLVDALYGGEPDGFRSRVGKAVSLRRLAARGVPLSPAALYRCLSVHEIWLRTEGHQWPRLGASHYRAVESLLPDSQASWLERAAQGRWSAAHLRHVIRAAGAGTVTRGGRLPQHPVARFVARVRRELTMLDRVVLEMQVEPDDREPMRHLADRLEELATRCSGHAARLRTAIRDPRMAEG